MSRIHAERSDVLAPEVSGPGDIATHPLLALQRTAGNAAIVSILRLQLQRDADTETEAGTDETTEAEPVADALSPAMAEQLARRLREAMEGWGTDEEAIYAAFGGRTQPQIDAITAAYRALFGRDLAADLQDELNASELKRLASLAPSTPVAAGAGSGGESASEDGEAMAGAAELAAMADRTNRAEVAVRQLRSAMEGWGTDEEAIFAVLTGRSAAERTEIADMYATTYRRTLESDLRDEMSGAELTEALRLLTAGELSAADELYQAITGAGTDEGRIMRVLEPLRGDDAAVNGLIADYRARYGGLLAALNGDLSGEELVAARDILGRPGHLAACREVLAGADPDLLHQVPDFTIMSVADRLLLVGRIHTETVVGGSDEDALERIWSSPDMAEPAAQNQGLYQSSRDRGAELPESLSTFGQFENTFEQDMFEGGTTVGHGLFDWTLVGDVLDVRVPINFEPADSVTVPYATWNGQIDSVWNQFAVTEPGGRKIALQFSMINDSGASRTVEVVQNATPGTWTPDDRANAGMFFEHMQASTVPHEFGHFIGLPDEYQRTHDDFIEITSTTKTGPANASGKTEAEIADELHTALHLDNQPMRRIEARTVLTTAGLLVAGIPEQGDFAQAVMAEYDDRHGTLKDDLISQLDADADSGDRWVLQTVFSYASNTVMGNPTVFGIHTHPVEPRHLREFVRIVQNRHPAETWTIGPK